ncbi:MAG: hypothetical protein HC888_01640 [Candidatus Competibacteraceae bacterium]|nr:hypothetical protein [Candidatus Competibacteraceae bacterium]
MPDAVDMIDAVWQAYNSQLGLVVKGDPTRIRAAFYAARATDPSLTALGLFNNPFVVDEFFILKREVYDAVRKARKENNAVSGGGLGPSDERLSAEGPDDFSLDP